MIEACRRLAVAWLNEMAEIKPDRWQKIEELYHAALERPVESRTDFLRSACGDDEELYREVESLLGFKSQAENFIERPALEIVAKAVAEGYTASVTGQQIGNYKILALLGQGAWAKSISLRTRSSAAKSRSNFFPLIRPPIATDCAASNRKRVRLRL